MFELRKKKPANTLLKDFWTRKQKAEIWNIWFAGRATVLTMIPGSQQLGCDIFSGKL